MASERGTRMDESLVECLKPGCDYTSTVDRVAAHQLTHLAVRAALNPIDPMKLDFSQFHPLDHVIGDRYCWSLYGGPRIHWNYWWDLKGWGYLRCRYLHQHSYLTFQHYTRPGDRSSTIDEIRCRHCGKKLPTVFG